MDEYFIGAGALLTAGPVGTIASATLHAQTDPALAGRVEAAVVDFEGSRAGKLTRILIIAAGWRTARFQNEVVRRLLAQRECGLAEVIRVLAQATGSREVHLFARWSLDAETDQLLRDCGVLVQGHPLEAIGQAALVSGQRLERWRSPVCAA
jgi:hypothetical protein